MLILSPTSKEGFVSVKSLTDAKQCWTSFDCVFTIEDVGFSEGLRIPASSRTQQFICQFDDIEDAGCIGKAPTCDQVRVLLLTARTRINDKLMVHCLQGQSRSAAIALAIIADRLGSGNETAAVKTLISIRASSVCNRLILKYADALLQRNGRLIEAWDDYISGSNNNVTGGLIIGSHNIIQ